MSNLKNKFLQLKKLNKTAFMPFLVAGYPNFKAGLKIARVLAELGDVLEIGFPYSDPLADGPVISEANAIAIKSGMTTQKVFKFIKQIRAKSDIPISVLAYSNLVYQQGMESFYRQAKEAGVDGVLVPDLPVEEAHSFVKAAKKFNISPIFLVAQTTSNERLKKILKYADGYLYLVAVLGITGVRKKFSVDTPKMVIRVKKYSKLPVAVGFGVSSRGQVKALKKAGAEGVVVGSALVKTISKTETKIGIKRKMFFIQKSLGLD